MNHRREVQHLDLDDDPLVVAIVDAGATLQTFGCPVYYVHLVLDGAVDDPASLMEIEQPLPCLADANNDNIVDVVDFLALLAACGSGDPVFDIAPEPDGDGAVDQSHGVLTWTVPTDSSTTLVRKRKLEITFCR